MALAELETLGRLALDVVVVVFNDALSLIAVKQDDEQGGDGAMRYSPIDFAAVAGSLGVPSFRADNTEELHDALVKALGRRGPCLIDVAVDPTGYAALLDAIRGGPASDASPER